MCPALVCHDKGFKRTGSENGPYVDPEKPLIRPIVPDEPVHMTAEEAIAELRAKIDRIGPVNMMAIEQSKELEERHGFLTSQRKDLVDSIAQTNEAISKIDETAHSGHRDRSVRSS